MWVGEAICKPAITWQEKENKGEQKTLDFSMLYPQYRQETGINSLHLWKVLW